MTYELPDEVLVAAVARASLALAVYHGDTDGEDNPQVRPYMGGAETAIMSVLGILASHFERSGAEKMREAAAERIGVSVIEMNNNGLRLPEPEWRRLREDCDLLLDAAAAIRALPLPSQVTNSTEEA